MHCNNSSVESFLHATEAGRSPHSAFASGNVQLKMAEHSPALSQLPNSGGVAAKALVTAVKVNTENSLDLTNIRVCILRNEIEIRVRSLARMPVRGVRVRRLLNNSNSPAHAICYKCVLCSFGPLFNCNTDESRLACWALARHSGFNCPCGWCKGLLLDRNVKQCTV